jgi:AcrR family transcriptional regulator
MQAPVKSAKVIPLQRKISRDARRQQLIAATMRVLARKGFAQTTLSDVAAEAGVSHGLVNFHFESKEKLLTATCCSWRTNIAGTGHRP